LEELHAWQATAPSDPEPHRALAQVLAGMDRMPEALREQEAVVAAVPDSAADWNDLGSLEAQTGDRVAAARDFDRALALDPGLAAAQENLNRLKRK
jgi:Flp pilus assembly protein TadD